ncbi:hypothetical protein [Pseudomonas fluorescens]|uniref:Uncharacterized protein n=1 Tax=Pseudomonas fluorescens TaxID=294 RepID=A0A5E7V780_PSEFL|nr:hypothetical protein [Pseudomonas fluorescens]VVQ19857.1 hypothetical protein PS941_04882 [Pseudomonas fluorescens]
MTYPGQLMPETTVLQMTKDAMIGAAKLASALLGTSTMASGFAVTPTGPASLQVVCGAGEIYSLAAIDALAFSTLPADTTHSILKQGILLDGVTLSCPAPGTTGQSINYLVQVTYQDSDSAPVLLPYYNSANPSMPYSGMGNNGLTQNTVRKGIAVVGVKAGASAITGSQVTPSPDAGYIGLYVVTVAFGQTTINAGSIVSATNAPFINGTLHGLAPVFTANPSVPAATAAAHATPLSQIVGAGAAALAAPVRAVGQTYNNLTGRPLWVCVYVGSGSGNGTTGSGYALSVGGVVVCGMLGPAGSGQNISGHVTAIVPPGASYVLNNAGNGSGFVSKWSEY